MLVLRVHKDPAIVVQSRPTGESQKASEVQRKRPLFRLGQILSTPGVLEHLDHHGVNAQPYLERHITGDFGDVCADDARENLFAIEQGFRILSVYTIAGRKVWCITEADRSCTTLLFPEEY